MNAAPTLFDALQILAIDLAARIADPGLNGATAGMIDLAETINNATRIAEGPHLREYLQGATLEQPAALGLQLMTLKDRTGTLQYRVYQLLRKGPASAQKMAAATGRTSEAVQLVLRDMRESGMAEPAGLSSEPRHGKPGRRPRLWRLVKQAELEEPDELDDVDEKPDDYTPAPAHPWSMGYASRRG